MLKNILTTIFLISTTFFIGCSPEPQQTIVCFGDSLTVCGGKGGKYSDWLSISLPQHIFINKGVAGDTLARGRKRFQRSVLASNPDVVIIELGANDFWQKKRTIEQLQADLTDMVQRAKTENIEVVIASCFGNRDYEKEEALEFSSKSSDFAQAIADMEQEVCKEFDCFYVPNMQVDIKPNGTHPYWEDMNHPNKAGNEFVAKRILPELKRALARSRKNMENQSQ